MRVRCALLAWTLALAACGPAPPPQPQRAVAAAPAPSAAPAAAAPSSLRSEAIGSERLVVEATERGSASVTVELAWPLATTTEPYPHERLAIGWLRASEVDTSGPTMEGMIQLLPRMRVFDVRGLGGHAAVTLPASEDATMLFAVLDREGAFLAAMFGAGPVTSAVGVVDVAAAKRGETMRLEAGHSTDAPERCTGDRLQLVEVDAPDVAAAKRGAKHRLCVQLPAGYAKDAKARYPVVYALPGLASSDVSPLRGSDHFGAVMDRIAAAAKREVIVVGVDTRSPYGSSYFASSPLQGDWERFGAVTMVAAIDARFRTIPRADARALVGHSTGGFDAVSLAMRHPEVFGAVGASSPDALDLDGWLWDAQGRPRPTWLGWMRLEDAMGPTGQLTSYAAAWSPDASAPRGYVWPVDLASGARREEIAAKWRAASPAAWLETPQGLARAKKLSGRMFITSGRRDEARLFEPAERFVQAARAKGIEVEWVPTDLGHLGDKRARLDPLMRYVLDRLATK